MINNISNITMPSTVVVNNSANKIQSNLPPNNSTVLLNVLDKQSSLYKVLIGGKVFRLVYQLMLLKVNHY